jgi:hypothetical protein
MGIFQPTVLQFATECGSDLWLLRRIQLILINVSLNKIPFACAAPVEMVPFQLVPKLHMYSYSAIFDHLVTYLTMFLKTTLKHFPSVKLEKPI